jgi:hypothetical protein
MKMTHIIAVVAALIVIVLTVPYLIGGSPTDSKITYSAQIDVIDEGVALDGKHYWMADWVDGSVSAELVGGSILDRWLRLMSYIDDPTIGPIPHRLQVSLRENFNGNWILVGEVHYDNLADNVQAAGYQDMTMTGEFYLEGVTEGDYQLQMGLWYDDPDTGDWTFLGGTTVDIHL